MKHAHGDKEPQKQSVDNECKLLWQPQTVTVAPLCQLQASAAPASTVSMAIHTPPNPAITTSSFPFLKTLYVFIFPLPLLSLALFLSLLFPRKHLKSLLEIQPGNVKLREKLWAEPKELVFSATAAFSLPHSSDFSLFHRGNQQFTPLSPHSSVWILQRFQQNPFWKDHLTLEQNTRLWYLVCKVFMLCVSFS